MLQTLDDAVPAGPAHPGGTLLCTAVTRFGLWALLPVPTDSEGAQLLCHGPREVSQADIPSAEPFAAWLTPPARLGFGAGGPNAGPSGGRPEVFPDLHPSLSGKSW